MFLMRAINYCSNVPTEAEDSLSMMLKAQLDTDVSN